MSKRDSKIVPKSILKRPLTLSKRNSNVDPALKTWLATRGATDYEFLAVAKLFDLSAYEDLKPGQLEPNETTQASNKFRILAPQTVSKVSMCKISMKNVK